MFRLHMSYQLFQPLLMLDKFPQLGSTDRLINSKDALDTTIFMLYNLVNLSPTFILLCDYLVAKCCSLLETRLVRIHFTYLEKT